MTELRALEVAWVPDLIEEESALLAFWATLGFIIKADKTRINSGNCRRISGVILEIPKKKAGVLLHSGMLAYLQKNL